MESKSIFNHSEPFNLISTKQQFDFIKFNQSSENLSVNQNSELIHNIITPSFKTLQSKDHSLRKPIRKGNYKFNGELYPQKTCTHNLDLTGQDKLFLQNYQEKFKFNQFYLLNEEVLRTAYIFLDNNKDKMKKYKNKKIAGEQQIIQAQWIEKYINTLQQMNMKQYEIFNALKIEKKCLFQEMFAILYQRWLFRKKYYLLSSKYIKRQNIFFIFKERSYPQPIQDCSISQQAIINKVQMMNQKYRRNLQNMYCYENLYNDHYRRKQLVAEKLSNLIQKMIQFNSGITEARIQINQEPSLGQIESKINIIIAFLQNSDEQHQKWFRTNINHSNRKKSSYIFKYAQFFANIHKQNKIFNKVKSSFHKNTSLKQEQEE